MVFYAQSTNTAISGRRERRRDRDSDRQTDKDGEIIYDSYRDQHLRPLFGLSIHVVLQKCFSLSCTVHGEGDKKTVAVDKIKNNDSGKEETDQYKGRAVA